MAKKTPKSKSAPTRRNKKHLKNLKKMQRGNAAATGESFNEVDFKSVLLNTAITVFALIIVAFFVSAGLQYKSGETSSHSAIIPSNSENDNAAIPAVDPLTVEVRILNGCGTQGAGREMTQRVRDLGFDVVESSNAENFDYKYTVVIGHTAKPELAQALADAIGCNRVSSQSDKMVLADVTMILGQDWEKYIKANTQKKKSLSPGVLIDWVRDKTGL